jgi:iron complex outermembrane receptor protein
MTKPCAAGRVPGLSVTGLALSLIVSFGAIGTAMAQEQVAQSTEKTGVERVVVTGSAIPRSETETPSPVQVITKEEIQKTGYTNVAEVLQALTTNGNSNLAQNFSGAFAGGACGVALRGLTVDATLVLIDGKRMAPYPISDDGQRSFVDVCSLPLGIVDRIEVLKDSGSALYGSDAIAGVVNVITRKTYVGSEVSADFGDSTHNDGIIFHVSATHGWGDLANDGHNTYLNVEYRHQDSISLAARSKFANFDYFGTYAHAPGFPPPPTVPGVVPPGNAFPFVYNLYGMTAPITNPGTPNATVGSTGTQLPGCPQVSPLGGCPYNIAPYEQVQPDTENINLWLRHSMRLTADWELVGTASMFNSKAQQLNVPGAVGPSSGSYTAGTAAWAAINGTHINTSDPTQNPIVLPAGNKNNPYCPPGSPPSCTQQAWLAYVFGDVGAENTLFDTTMYRLAFDLTGNVMGWDTSTSIGVVHGSSDVTYQNYPTYSGLLSVIADNSYGVGALASTNSASVYQRLAPTTAANLTSQRQYLELNANRDLFALPGGPLGVGVGISLQHWGQDDPGQPGAAQGDVIGLGTTFDEGTETDQAAHMELAIPVLKQLELDGQVRFDKVIGTGSAISPKGSFKFTPIEQIALRGTYSRGFRAPGPGEKGKSGVTFFTSLPTDNIPNPANGLTRCGVTGLPSDCGAGTGFGAISGNPNLQPEKSEAYDLGIVLQPIPSVSLSADWYKIRRKDYILGGVAFTLVRGPVQAAFPNLLGPIIGIVGPYENVGLDATSGLEFDAQGRHEFAGLGTFSLHGTWTHLIYYDFCGGNFPGVPANGCVDVAGTHGPSGISGNTGTPKDRGQAIISFDRGPYEAGFTINYVSGYSLADPTTANFGLGQTGGCRSAWYAKCRVASFTDVDLFGHYDLTKKLQINGHIMNILDKDAPFDPEANYGVKNYSSNWAQAGAVGRFFQVGMRYVF